MRADRLLSLLLLLQTRGLMTATQLSEELEVSVRTVYRDVEALSSAGVPVYADRGPAGGYRLLEGYRTRLTGLTSGEAESLFLTGMPGPAAELGLAAELAAAELKLLAALPAELRTRAERMRERFLLDLPDWHRPTAETPHLAAVADAVWAGHRLRIGYRRWSAPAPVQRTVDPLGLVLKAGLWYLVAAVGEPAAPRTYRISNITTTEPLPEPAARPEGFDLAGYWAASTEEFAEGMLRHRATVLLTPEGLDALNRAVSPTAARTVRETAGPPEPDGRVRAVYRYEFPQQAVEELTRLGPEVELVEPEPLRALIRDTALATARRHGAD